MPCSTPFGITGFGTTVPLLRTRRCLSAQRLSASLDSAHRTTPASHPSAQCAQRLSASLDSAQMAAAMDVSELPRCSTPFGITGFGTGYHESRGWRDRVLNAFRHHWIRHATFSTTSATRRLSAQRLSASLDSARQGFGALRQHYVGVLNAFRHHWIRHTASNCASLAAFSGAQRLSASLDSAHDDAVIGERGQHVLNAFRHHWIRHLAPEDAVAVRDGVLNAFRHHWIRHRFPLQLKKARDFACSTPFGITGFGTTPSRPDPSAIRGAQRLSASLDSAQTCARPSQFGVLNAFRHHWIRHTLTGATASIVHVLNAFRHHWIRHAVMRPSRYGVCSTPFGITGFGTPHRQGVSPSH